MESHYKPGDRIITKINGIEVEASIVRLSVEAEVKTADGKLWWRAVSRVRLAGSTSTVEIESGGAVETVISGDSPSGAVEADAAGSVIPAPAPSESPDVLPANLLPSSEEAGDLQGENLSAEVGESLQDVVEPVAAQDVEVKGAQPKSQRKRR